MLRALHPEIPDCGTVVLEADEGHHLIRVRRATPGTPVQLLDGRGSRAQALLTEAHPKRAVLEIQAVERLAAPPHPIWLLQALPKGKVMDGVVQRATELGIRRILPLVSDHSEVRLEGDRSSQKARKWLQVADESIKQCGNPWRPVIDEPMDLATALACLPGGTAGLVACLRPPVRAVRAALGAAPLGPADQPIALAVGPEGDFSEREYDTLAAAGWHSVTLGPLVLRVETASCTLLALVLDALREQLES